MKRLALFLDGTWNDPGHNTNVWRLKLMLARRDPRGVHQLPYYHRGVGTAWHDRFSGGAFGRGLSRHVCRAYQWLMEHYDAGDEVYLFGFSRGAFTARSLAGMIAKCGLLVPEAPMAVPEIFEYYQQRRVPLYQLEYLRRHPEDDDHDWMPEEKLLLKFSDRIPIKFIGVFDTVGALGIPVGRIRNLSHGQFGFHHTRLSKIFEHAYQALAIDEHRRHYAANPWRRFVVPGEQGNADQDLLSEGKETQQAVEQRWFLGAHCNVGGGYRLDPLAQIPLQWMQDRASGAGLHFRRRVELLGDEYRAEVRDSFGEFLRGSYRLWNLNRRSYRTLLAAPERRTAHDGTVGTIETVNETIDDSVLWRWQEDECYRPKNLHDCLRRCEKFASSVI